MEAYAMREMAPVVTFVYNRPLLTKKMLEAIDRNDLASQTEMYIFCDGERKESDKQAVEEVRALVRQYAQKSAFKKVYITEAEKNQGLANSIIAGVTKVIEKHGEVIVLEDDLITSPIFLKFMNDCLEYYKNDKKIWSIGGIAYVLPSLQKYQHDVFLSYRGVSWGWATWKDRWDTVDWNVSDYYEFIKDRKRKKMFKRGGPDMVSALRMQMEGKTDSWAIRWCYQQSKLDMLTVLPKKTLIENIGWDGSGTHCGTDNRFETKIDSDFTYCLEKVNVDKRLIKECRAYFSRPLLNRVLDFIYLKMKESKMFGSLIEHISNRNQQKRELKK